MALRAPIAKDPLRVKLRVDRVRSDLSRVKLAPELNEAVVVSAAAERAWTMSGRERRRLVEEEQLREAAGLEQGMPVPAFEPEPARDPATSVVSPPDAPGVVVEAAAVAVDEAAGGVGDELAERGDAVLERHYACRMTGSRTSARVGVSTSSSS